MIEINLLPAKVLQRRKMWSFVIFVAVSGLLVIFACIFFFFSIKEEVKSAQIELAWVRERVNEYQPILKELQELKSKRLELVSRLSAIRDLIVNQLPWPLVLYEISKSLPDSIWLTELTKTIQGKEQVIAIQGYSLDKTVDIGRFVENLSRSFLFEEIAVSNMSRSIIEETEVMDFRISCRLRDPAEALRGL